MTEYHSVRRTVAILTLCIATLGANSLGFGPLASVIAGDLGVGIARVMMAAGSYGICTALGALFLSPLIDRHGARKALTYALLVMASAFLVSMLAPDTVWLITAQGAAGLGAGVALPAVYALAAQIAPKGRESAVLGRVLFGWTISMVAGVVLATVIADLTHWRLFFGLLAIIAAIGCRLVPRFAAGAQTPAAQSSQVGISTLRAARCPGVMPMLIGCFALMTAFYGTYGYIGDHIHRTLAMPLSASGLMAMVYGVGFGLAVLGDPALDRYGVRRLLPWCFATIAIVHFALGFAAPHYVTLLAIGFFWGFFNHFGLNLIVSGLSSIDPARRGAILGLNSAVTYVAASAGALVFGPLYTETGFGVLAVTGGAIMAVASVFLAALPGAPARQTVKAV